jgi:hypothetical protein
MSVIKYLLDENVDPGLRTGLHRNYPEMMIWCVGDPGAPPRGTLDPEILRWCEDHQAILVTNNRASMPVHLRDHLAARQHVPGIFILNATMSMGETIEALALIWEVAEVETYFDQLRFLPIS